MTFTKKVYGKGDPNFTGITAYSRDGSKEVVAVEIPNGARSGSMFVKPTGDLIKAMQLMEQAELKGEVFKGAHALTLARSLGATHGLNGSRFYDSSTDPQLSTREIGGSNNAIAASQRKLEQQGMALPAFDPIVKEIEAQRRAPIMHAVALKGSQAAPTRPGKKF